MTDLQQYQAKICETAVGFLVYQDNVLLVHHKKLGIWLAPGGHVDENELPHQAAEREFYEETGIRVRARHSQPLLVGEESEYIPHPIFSNLHWISKENYEKRKSSNDPAQYVASDKFPRGCEQHVSHAFLMEPVNEENMELSLNQEETHDIGWFGLDEIETLETTSDIKQEIRFISNLVSVENV